MLSVLSLLSLFYRCRGVSVSFVSIGVGFKSCICTCRYHFLPGFWRSIITGETIFRTLNGSLYFGESFALNAFAFIDSVYSFFGDTRGSRIVISNCIVVGYTLALVIGRRVRLIRTSSNVSSKCLRCLGGPVQNLNTRENIQLSFVVR